MTIPPIARSLARFRVFGVLLLVLGVVLAGCGPSYKVPDAPAQALQEAEAKVKAAEEAKKARSANVAQLWQEAAGFYGAVSHKFPNQPEGMQAALRAAEITSVEEKNDYTAWLTLQQTLRKNFNSPLPEKAQLEAKRDELAQKMDRDNSTNPFYKVMDGLVRLCGNNPQVSPTIAIFVIAILVAVVLWPMQIKQYRSFKEMAKYQPQIKEIQTKYKEEPLVMQQKLNEFNKEHGINPMSGCLMILPQTVIFILMIQLILKYQFHFTSAHFLWVNPASGATSLTWPAPFTGIVAHHLGEIDTILLGLYALSQFLQTKLLPPPSDPQQAEVQKTMGTIFPIFYFFWMWQNQVPSAFVLYYFVSTILGMLRQWIMNRITKDEGSAPVVLSASGGPVEPTGGSGLSANSKLISPKNRKKK